MYVGVEIAFKREADRKAHRGEVKAFNKHNEMVMEELVPKATGRYHFTSSCLCSLHTITT
jgi:hypothetical protein